MQKVKLLDICPDLEVEDGKGVVVFYHKETVEALGFSDYAKSLDTCVLAVRKAVARDET